VVSWKNGLSGTLSVPRANSTPNIAASARPMPAPAHSIRPPELNSAAARKMAVSKPSRTTIAKPNTATPNEPPLALRASPLSTSSFIARRGPPHPPGERQHEARAHQHGHALDDLLVPDDARGEHRQHDRDGDGDGGARQQCRDTRGEPLAAQQSRRDRQHQRGFHPFPEGDDQGFEHQASARRSRGRTRESGASADFHAWHTRGEQNPNAASFSE
jgi:hypothetical protein